MKKCIKNVVIAVVVIAVVLGIGIFVARAAIVRRPWSKDDLYQMFKIKADFMYSTDEGPAGIRMQSGEYVTVMVGNARGGEEAYYEVYKLDERAPGEDLWNGPMTRGKIRKGDEMETISQEIKGQPTQWIYLFFHEGDTLEVQVADGEESKSVTVKADTPLPVITETPPEEIRVIRGR